MSKRLALALWLATLPAVAQSEPLRISDAALSGDVQVGLVSGSGGIAHADLDLAIPVWRGFGLGIGLFGYYIDGKTPHETYGAVTWTVAGGGRLAIGVPRPAYDGFAVTALDRAFPGLAAPRVGQSRSLVTWGAMYGGFLPYGASWQDSRGAMRYAASLHDVPYQNLRLVSLGVETDVGDWQVSGAAEIASTGRSNAKVQIIGPAGPVTAGLTALHPGATGGPDLIEAFAIWQARPALSLTTLTQVPLDGSAALSGVAADWQLGPQDHLNIGLAGIAGHSYAAVTLAHGF